MPFSSEHNLIHVAIPKTGSTSIIRALTLMQPPGCQLALWREKVDADFRRRYCLDEIGDKRPGRTKHLSALQIQYVLGEEQFQSSLKFSLVRNPWGRTLSRYFFHHKQYEPSRKVKKNKQTKRSFHRLSFEAWLEKKLKRYRAGRTMGTQVGKLVDRNGELLVDHVGRLEQAQDSLDWLTSQLRAPTITMPYVNGTHRGNYRDYYNDATREIVAEICEEDIKYFDYTF